MKIKKILSLAITLMMVLSVASIPAMAASTLPEGAYANVVNSNSVSSYTLDEFKADFAAADYTTVNMFESDTNVKASDTQGKTNVTANASVSGVENGMYYLKLNSSNASRRFWLYPNTGTNNESVENGVLPSGTRAIRFTYSSDVKMTFTAPDSANNVVTANEEQLTELKITTFAIALRPFASQTVTVDITYEDTTKEETQTISLPGGSTNYFYGFKADAGKAIAKVEIGTEKDILIDDLSLIFDEIIVPASVEIADVDVSVAEPKYGGVETLQLSAVAKDAEGNEIEGAVINWSVSEKSGVSISENGLLTIKRTGAASIGDVTVTAKAALNESATDTKTISITPTEAYFTSSEMVDYSASAYTRADFLTDLNAADYKYVMNFEEGVSFNNNSRKTIAYLNSKVSTVDSEYKVTVNSWKDKEHNEKQAKFDYSDSTMVLNMTGNGEFEFVLPTTNVAETRKPVAVGMMLGKNTSDLNYKLRIYLDNNEEIEYTGIGEKEVLSLGCGFFGYKAPGGRYITMIELETGAAATIDDLCFIFEDPSAAPITFSTDEAGKNLIGSINGLTGDIYINVAGRTTFADKKVLLALYGGDELLDVAMVDASATEAVQTSASIPSGKTLTTVKAFVWNMERLVPVQNDIVLDK